MASLNTLRTKFGIVLSVVIAFALLAFILSLKTEMGFTGNDPKIGVIDGQKINYTEYYNQLEQMRQQSGATESDEQQTDMLHNATWQSLVARHVLEPGFEQVGIRVTKPERMAMISGEQPSQAFFNAFADPRTGIYNVAAVQQFLQQAETNVEASRMWDALNEQARLERELQKYIGLVKGGVYVNALEVDNGVAAANNTYSGKWAGMKYAQVPDSLFAASTSEIKAYYNSHKDMFKQEPSRTISYVLFEVNPTDADMTALEELAMQTGTEFAAATDLKAFVRANRKGQIADRYVSAAQLSAEEAEALMNGKNYGPVLKNNVWTMSRVVDEKIIPDSMGVKHIVLPFSADKQADSLIEVLKGGADFGQLAAQYSVFDQTAAQGGEVGVMPFSAFTGEFATALAGAKAGDIVKIPAGDAIQIMLVYRADKPSKQVQLATINYPVEPSEATRRDIHNQAGSFTVNAKGSVEKFNEAATTASLTPRIAALSQSERAVRGLEDSREIVRWANGAEVGAQSEIFTVGKDYVVATLTEIDDEEYTSVDKAAAQVRGMVTRDKKYDYIVNKISGTNLAEQAQSLGSEVADFAGANYASYFIGGVGMEPRMIGAIASTTETGKVSAPVKGMSGVYVFQVDEILTDAKQTPEGERVRDQATAEGYAQQASLPAVQQMAKIQDLRGKFF